MSDDFISDGTFKGIVLAGISTGLAYIGYSNFYKRKSYLVEWSAQLNDPQDSGGDCVNNDQDGSIKCEEICGTTAFTARPTECKTHEDIFHHAQAKAEKETPALQGKSFTFHVRNIHIL